MAFVGPQKDFGSRMVRSFSQSGEGGAKRRMRGTGGRRIKRDVAAAASHEPRNPHPVLRTTFSFQEKELIMFLMRLSRS
jgi:hypothetical protein